MSMGIPRIATATHTMPHVELNMDLGTTDKTPSLTDTYLFTILPKGVVSKNDIGARSILSSNLACSIPAALTPPT